MKTPASAPAWSTSPSCCCGRSSCGATTPSWSRTTAAASATCWSTSSRTPTRSSTAGCKLLAGADGAPFAVGDDDQSIYRWRGAKVENLQQFRRDFPKALLCRLEQNYRSTSTILNAANALIAHNSGRLGKNLWTNDAKGEPIRIYAAFNERDEAEFVLQRIRDWVAHGGLRRDIAILYRSNAQSRVFEEVFLSARVPYRVYGGLRFFERAEIKDALAYLRLVSNRDDDTSFERVINLPTRGIGAKSLDTLREAAKRDGSSLWKAAQACIAHPAWTRAAWPRPARATAASARRPPPPCRGSCS